MMHKFCLGVVATVMLLALLLAGCTPSVQPAVRPAAPIQATGFPVHVVVTPLAQPSACSGVFVAHPLDHITTTADGVVRQFEANGSGIAVNDLDNDGDLDLVLGNHAGPNSIFWNEGDLRLRKESFGQGRTRAVLLVDVDGDGWQDMVLTLNTGALNYWHNLGAGKFERIVLPGVARAAYAINWGDLDADGDLDLVTASYDAGFLSDNGSNYLLERGGGVLYYENQDLRFRPTTLASEAQALALGLFDLNNDLRPDILVGNDFAVPDMAWLRTHNGWQAATPFAYTTHSTMSFDQGDIDNDGQNELFASDMKPYSDDAAMQATYAKIMASMMEGMSPATMANEPQLMENVLQRRDAKGAFVNHAPALGVDATGWSWSGKFGDLDNDGFLDLYVVNGMIEEKMFADLPNHELVEENQAFRNTGQGGFQLAPQWQLNATYSGRSMVMADLDDDGDLEIVVNNLRSPAQLYENQLCGGHGLEVELNWRTVANHKALGAIVQLHTNQGTLTRDLRAASGYLSGDAPRVHFGLSPAMRPVALDIHWPDGEVTFLPGIATQQLIRVER